MPDSSIIQRVASLPKLTKPELSDLWWQLFKKDPPEIRKELMVRIVAHRLQEEEFGALSDVSCRRLRQLASLIVANPDAALCPRPLLKSGTRLVRQWKEQIHVVEVKPEGFEYRGTRYESLSEIARLITGTRWSGPLFFGIKRRQSNDSQEVQ